MLARETKFASKEADKLRYKLQLKYLLENYKKSEKVKLHEIHSIEK